MVRDRISGGLIQAWPQLERELLEVTFCFGNKANIDLVEPVLFVNRQLCVQHEIRRRSLNKLDLFFYPPADGEK